MTDLPAKGEWPCQTEFHIRLTKDGNTLHDSQRLEDGTLVPERLVVALYLLLRDHVVPGAMEDVLLQLRKGDGSWDLTNPHLEALARAHAAYLLQHPIPWPAQPPRGS